MPAPRRNSLKPPRVRIRRGSRLLRPAAGGLGPTLGASSATASGRPSQGHLFYAANAARWWLLYLDQASATTLRAAWSTDLAAWTDAAATATLTVSVASGHNLAAAYKNIASTDVVHIGYGQRVAGNDHRSYHLRAIISGTTITFGSSAQVTPASTATDGGAFVSAVAVAIDAADTVYHAASYIEAVSGWGNAHVAASTNADTGASWTAGFAAPAKVVSPSQAVESAALDSLGSGLLLGVWDNGAALGTDTDLAWSKLSAGTWTPALPPGAVFGSASTQDKNDWGAVALTTSDVHVVRRTGANTYEHDRFNGTDWTTLAGAAIPTQNSKAAAGLFLATDGTSVVLIVVDSDAANTVRWVQWSGGSWGSWQALESSTQTRTAISGHRAAQAGTVGVLWTEDAGGGAFRVVSEPLTLAAGTDAAAGSASVGWSAADAQVAVAVDATPAAVPVVAADAGAGVAVNAGSASITVAAADAAVAVEVAAGAAAVPVAAADASPAVTVDAAAATVAFVAADAAVSTAITTNADAQPATVTVAAADASVAVEVAAGAAVAPLAAADATAGVSPAAGAGSLSWAAADAAVAVEVNAGSATITVAAADATVSTLAFTNADAQPATLTFAAADAQAAVSPAAGAAVVSFTAADATAVNAVDVQAQPASITVAAADATVAVATNAAAATVAFVAADATGQASVAVAAGSAAITMAAADASVAVAAQAGAAAMPFAAADPFVYIPPPVPPPRWVEGNTTASGLTEGAATGSGQVEGVLVSAGIVEGGSSL